MVKKYAFGFERKLTPEEIEEIMQTGGLDDGVVIMPESPVAITKDENGNVTNLMYGDMDRVVNGEPVVLWSQDLVRDETGSLSSIITYLPDGSMTEETFVKDETGSLTGTTVTFL